MAVKLCYKTQVKKTNQRKSIVSKAIQRTCLLTYLQLKMNRPKKDSFFCLHLIV